MTVVCMTVVCMTVVCMTVVCMTVVCMMAVCTVAPVAGTVGMAQEAVMVEAFAPVVGTFVRVVRQAGSVAVLAKR
jgi:hypothetical protein